MLSAHSATVPCAQQRRTRRAGWSFAAEAPSSLAISPAFGTLSALNGSGTRVSEEVPGRASKQLQGFYEAVASFVERRGSSRLTLLRSQASPGQCLL